MRIELLVYPASLVAAPAARVPAAAPAAAPNGGRRGGHSGRYIIIVMEFLFIKIWNSGARRGRFIRGGKGGSKQTPKTAEELDAEMDTYMKDEVMGEAAA